MCETEKRHRSKNRLLDSMGEGEGGMILENIIETCILPYVKQMTSPSSMHEAGHSEPVHWDNPEGWGGEGGGKGALGQGTNVHPWLILSMYGKSHQSIIKYLASNYNKLIFFKEPLNFSFCCL